MDNALETLLGFWTFATFADRDAARTMLVTAIGRARGLHKGPCPFWVISGPAVERTRLANVVAALCGAETWRTREAVGGLTLARIGDLVTTHKSALLPFATSDLLEVRERGSIDNTINVVLEVEREWQPDPELARCIVRIELDDPATANPVAFAKFHRDLVVAGAMRRAPLYWEPPRDADGASESLHEDEPDPLEPPRAGCVACNYGHPAQMEPRCGEQCEGENGDGRRCTEEAELVCFTPVYDGVGSTPTRLALCECCAMDLADHMDEYWRAAREGRSKPMPTPDPAPPAQGELPLVAKRGRRREVALVTGDVGHTNQVILDFPHVWDVDGRPRGVRHRLTLGGETGETLEVVDVALDEHGREVAGLDLGRRTMAFVDAVHVLVNITPDELKAIVARGPA